MLLCLFICATMIPITQRKVTVFNSFQVVIASRVELMGLRLLTKYLAKAEKL